MYFYVLVYATQQVAGVKQGLDAVTDAGDDANADADGTEERTALISKFAHLKPTAMSSPFLSAFQEQNQLSSSSSEGQNEKGELKIVKYREEEAIYVQASADRVTVIFGTVFKEETDRIYGRLFLQEFVDARKLQSLQSAPQVQYSNREPPLEIRHVPGLKNGEDWGYVTFSMSFLSLVTCHLSLACCAA